MYNLLPGLLWLAVSLSAAHASPHAAAVAANEGTGDARFVPRAKLHEPRRGNLRLTSVLVAGGEPYPGTRFTILREQPDDYGKTRATLMAVAGPKSFADFSLNPGRYRVQARNGAVTVEQWIDIPAGAGLQAEIELGAGELQLHAMLDRSGTPADQAWYRVYREDTDPYGRPLLVQVASDGYGESAGFVLPAGAYIAETSFGDATVREPVSVVAGRGTSYDLALDAGRVELTATLSDAGEPADGVVFTMLRIDAAADGAPTEVASAADAASVTFVLPKGRYLARARLDRVVVEQAVSIEPGETVAVDLTLQAAELLVYATLAGRSDALLDSWFDVGTDSSAGKGRSGDARGPDNLVRFVLPAGTHRVYARHGESSGFSDVTVEAGTTQTVAVDLDAGRVSVRMTTRQRHAGLPYTWFSVYRVEHDDAGKSRRHRVFNHGYYTSTDIVLPSGDYVAIGRTDRHRGELAFTVEPGVVKRVDIVSSR